MKKGAYQQLNLSHLEAALPQVVQAAQREQWTYETFLNGHWPRSWRDANRRPWLDAQGCAHPCKKTLDGFDFSFQPRFRSAGCENWLISRLCGHAPILYSLALQEPGKRI